MRSCVKNAFSVRKILHQFNTNFLGTGKTLMARQIGKMLNCREPKIISGPGREI